MTNHNIFVAEERRLYREATRTLYTYSEICGICGKREATDENGEFLRPCPRQGKKDQQ